MNDAIKILLIAIALSMDAVSVSLAVGARAPKNSPIEALKMSSSFGMFQAAMPLIGWLIGSSLSGAISDISQWISFVLLAAVGSKMIYESFKHDDDEIPLHPSNKKIILLSVATSIDALIIGTTLRLENLPLIFSISVIGIVTFGLCLIAYYSGRFVGKLFGEYVEIIGGIILICIGITFLVR